MKTSRVEAFSDGVIAILITIMVLELKVPHGETAQALVPLIPVFLSYVLSFAYLGIYWNDHHHMLQTCDRVTGPILWANLHLLFWLSLIPFTTSWMGENHFAAVPSALYGLVLLMAALAYWMLQHLIIASQGRDLLLKRAIGGDWKGKQKSPKRASGEKSLKRAIGGDWKGKGSPLLYLIAIAVAFRSPGIAPGCSVLIALLGLIPDQRIERVLSRQDT